jgi:hypothetical protein
VRVPLLLRTVAQAQRRRLSKPPALRRPAPLRVAATRATPRSLSSIARSRSWPGAWPSRARPCPPTRSRWTSRWTAPALRAQLKDAAAEGQHVPSFNDMVIKAAPWPCASSSAPAAPTRTASSSYTPTSHRRRRGRRRRADRADGVRRRQEVPRRDRPHRPRTGRRRARRHRPPARPLRRHVHRVQPGDVRRDALHVRGEHPPGGNPVGRRDRAAARSCATARSSRAT